MSRGVPVDFGLEIASGIHVGDIEPCKATNGNKESSEMTISCQLYF